MTEDMSDQFQFYRRKQSAEMRPWRPGEPEEGLSISEADKAAGSPKEGDMILRANTGLWLLSAAYFDAHYEREPIG